jgi:CubicO group peptidase (beta-lactamase class C family)
MRELMKLNIFVCVALCFLIATKSIAQVTNFFENDSLDKYIQQAIENWQIPGAAVCIVKDGKILLQKGYGVRDWKTKSKVDEQTIFPIASVTKTFTGTLFATMEAEGKISLNDLVKKWLPQFIMKDKLYEQQITLTDVLSHRSGWKTFQGDFINTETALDYATMINLFGKQTPAYPIRTRFGYSNFGFMIAGECVKNITGQSWNEYLQKRFLIPLKMNRTLVFENEIKNDTNKVSGHTMINDTLIVLSPHKVEPYSHGGIYASIQDMGTWMKVLLNKGNLEDKNIVPESAITKVWQSNTIVGKSKAADRKLYLKTYGLGWEILQYHTVEVMQHNGAYAGTLTSLAIVPELNLGIAILTNQDNHLFHETLKWQIFDASLQRIAPNYTLSIIERQKKRNAENVIQPKSDKLEVEDFAINLDAILGTYSCDFYGKAYITKEKYNYVLTLEHHPKLQGIITLYKKDKLTCTYNNPMFGKVQFPFVFEKNEVKSFTLFVDSFVEADGYEFSKVK